MANATQTNGKGGNIGSIIQVIGPTVDVRFDPEHLPPILNALRIDYPEQGIHLTIEVALHIGDEVVRCVAMSSTDGLVRDMKAVDSGGPIQVPVGRQTLGRVFNLLGELIDKTVMVFGQMNEPPGARLRVGLTGVTMAEYFRDQENQDVLFFVDNIFRFVQAGSEVSALLGRMPSAVGYQPTLSTEMGALQERITTTKKGSITSVQAIYVPADDLTDPAPATAFAHLDATTVLERSIAELGIYPAVDPLASTSRILDPAIVGEEHYKVARDVQRILQRYKDLPPTITISGG